MKYSHTKHAALASLLEKAGMAIISPDYANTKGFEAKYIGVKVDRGNFLYQFEDVEGDVWDCNSSEIDEISEANLQQNEILLHDEIISLLKATAIGTYTSNGENANDYDALMSADSFGDIPHLVLWEPFENYPIDDIKEYVESEFDSLCTVVKKSIEMYYG